MALNFDSFSHPVASIVFGDMAMVLLFLLLFFSQSQILSGKVQAHSVEYHLAILSGYLSFCKDIRFLLD